ncbi:MAG: hypothetical protein ACYSSI_00315 [Planctomycetota bacterium]|jgi:hypothetical protein
MSTPRECEVTVSFEVPKNKMQHIYNAATELAKAGITFDTGGTCTDPVSYDWEFDGSLKGARVKFKRFRDNVDDN